jgi:hypothetical protein
MGTQWVAETYTKLKAVESHAKPRRDENQHIKQNKE